MIRVLQKNGYILEVRDYIILLEVSVGILYVKFVGGQVRRGR